MRISILLAVVALVLASCGRTSADRYREYGTTKRLVRGIYTETGVLQLRRVDTMYHVGDTLLLPFGSGNSSTSYVVVR